MALPKCGLYRTTADIESVPAGRLVYFHNHGDPGPGIYLPESWNLNRAKFSKQGTTLTDESLADHLEPLAEEGLYRVVESFTCCDKNCRTYDVGLLTQLGYDGEAHPLLFVPEWTTAGLGFPHIGQPIDPARISRLEPLKVAQSREEAPSELH